MNHLTPHPEYQSILTSIQALENELSKLVFERDNLIYHMCPKIQTEYMLKIGKLEYAVFEYQCNTLRIKRKIEIIQAALNRDQSYNINEIDKQLDEEHKENTKKLLEKQKEIDNARLKNEAFGKPLTKEETFELKKNLYANRKKSCIPISILILQKKIDELSSLLTENREQYEIIKNRITNTMGWQFLLKIRIIINMTMLQNKKSNSRKVNGCRKINLWNSKVGQ